MRKEKVLKGPHKRMCIIVGAQRAGSTYLLKVLGEHPEISIQRPTQPEPKFFFVEDEYEKGIEYYERKFFSHGKEKDVWVEKSVSYYEEGTGTVARRIKEAYPNCRILFILRDPTQRALSNYFYSRKNCLEDRTLEEVFLDEIPPNKNPLGTSVSPFNYMRRGEYEKFIKVFRDVFDKEQINILIYEKFVADPDAIMDLYGYLGVSRDFLPNDIISKVNAARDPNKRVDERIIRKLNDHFKGFNDDLEKYLESDLGVWKQC